MPESGRGAESDADSGPRARFSSARHKHHLLRVMVLGSLVAVVINDDLRSQVLDALFGAEEEFDYTSITEPVAPGSPPPQAAGWRAAEPGWEPEQDVGDGPASDRPAAFEPTPESVVGKEPAVAPPVEEVADRSGVAAAEAPVAGAPRVSEVRWATATAPSPWAPVPPGGEPLSVDSMASDPRQTTPEAVPIEPVRIEPVRIEPARTEPASLADQNVAFEPEPLRVEDIAFEHEPAIVEHVANEPERIEPVIEPVTIESVSVEGEENPRLAASDGAVEPEPAPAPAAVSPPPRPRDWWSPGSAGDADADAS